MFRTPLEAGCLINSEIDDPYLAGFFVRAVRTAKIRACYWNFLERISDRDLEFQWDIPKDME